MKKFFYAALAVTVVTLAGCSSPSGDGGSEDGAAASSEPVTYDTHINPVIQAHCGKCHVEGEKGELSLASLESALAGGKSGNVIVPGDSAGSQLYQMVSGQAEKRMPPKGDPLSDEQIATIQQWIDGGAK